jgi:superfamily I DNA/RNA helicase
MLKGLNKQQIEAVTEIGNVLLTACPGSGKTRALIYKIAYELERLNNSKKSIVAVTFTNRAVDEIKKRIRYLDTDDSSLWAGTIHSFCLEWILRPYMCYLDELKNGFSISDEYNSEALINDLKKEYGLKYWDSVSTRYLVSGEKEEVLHRELIDDYHEYLKNEKLIDFNQILHYAHRIISEFPKIAETLKNMFHLICVDEYQDTQGLQYAVLAEIIKAKYGNCKMFMVGDADQAIYGSLGGVAKSIEEIQSQFGNVDFIGKELSGNYRSNQQIIDYYRNFQTTEIEIEALGKNASESGIITYSKAIHKDNIHDYIAQIIEDKITSGIPENEICVLAPTWYLVIPMGRKLKTLLPELNFDAVGLSPLLKNKENLWFKIARLFLVEPSPKSFFTRKRWATELINELKDIGIIIFEESEYKSKKLLKLINSVASEEDDGLAHLEECFLKLFEELNIDTNRNDFLKLHWETFFEGAKNRLENQDFNFAKDIESFRKMFKHESGVVVNTCHGIKGEEFDTVIAFGLLHGKLPNWNENTENAANKLLYVICSRAKRELHLISETGWATKYGKPYYPTTQLNNVDYEYN